MNDTVTACNVAIHYYYQPHSGGVGHGGDQSVERPAAAHHRQRRSDQQGELSVVENVG